MLSTNRIITPLQLARNQIIHALRAAEEGPLELEAADTINRSLTEALRLLSWAEDEVALEAACAFSQSIIDAKGVH